MLNIWLKKYLPVWLLGSTVVLSLYFVFYQSLHRGGLWGDELSLTNSYFRDWLLLLKPLEGHQVAPVLMVFIEKFLLICADITSGSPDVWLRVYPLFCSIGIMGLYYPTLYRYTKIPALALFSTMFLLFAPYFVYYGSEVKQYIGELFATVLLLFVYSFKDDSKKFLYLFCGTVLYCVLTTHIICFVLLPLGLWDTWQLLRKYNFAWKKMLTAPDVRLYVVRYTLCLLFLVGYYFLFLYDHPNKDFMNTWWEKYFLTGQNGHYLLKKLLTSMFAPEKWLCWAFYAGIFSLLLFKNKFLFVFTIGMLGGHLLFSYWGFYPVRDRLVLYWYPVISLVFGSLVYWCIKIPFCLLLQKRADVLITLTGCLIIICFWLENSYRLPVVAHRSSDKFILEEMSKDFGENDLSLMQDRGFGRYAEMYYWTSKNKFRHEDFWGRTHNPLWDAIKTDDKDKSLLPLTQKVIDYAFLNRDYEKYDRLWLAVMSDNPDAVQRKINAWIERKNSGQILEKCKVFPPDTVLCAVRQR